MILSFSKHHSLFNLLFALMFFVKNVSLAIKSKNFSKNTFSFFPIVLFAEKEGRRAIVLAYCNLKEITITPLQNYSKSKARYLDENTIYENGRCINFFLVRTRLRKRRK